MIRALSTFFLVMVLTALALGGWVYLQVSKIPDTVVPISEETEFSVAPGTSALGFARELENRGWLSDARWMRILFRLHPEMTQLKAGEYLVEPGITLGALFAKVNRGDSIQHRITLVEGSTVKELLAQLKADERLTHELAATNAVELAAELALKMPTSLEQLAPSAEGLFLAETYLFERGMSDRDLLQRAHQLLLEQLERVWEERQPELPLESPYEALILASIIEKETGLAAERPEIAGVFIRRLNRGMRLQTDPTVIYGMGDQYTGNITRKDLRTPTPYNTYVIPALPPTPIAAVGPAALEASVNPNEGTSLFFVARGDGSHQFSDTLDQHNRAVREYQLNRRSDYRSSPGAAQ